MNTNTEFCDMEIKRYKTQLKKTRNFLNNFDSLINVDAEVILSNLMGNLFKARKIVIATKHQKERVITPLLEKELGLECIVSHDLDTDVFGTFTGEIERLNDPVETARLKCLKAMEQTGCDMAISNEGSFGLHPTISFVHADSEIVLLIDKKNKLEFIVREISTKTNFNGSEIKSYKALKEFAKSTLFPLHGLILRKSNDFKEDIYKGITSVKDLKNAYTALMAKYGSVYAETDMRALYNPTRMQVIENAVQKLIAKIKTHCPKCDMPGFSITGAKPGLKCENCGLPTRSPLLHLLSCQYCGYTEKKCTRMERYLKTQCIVTSVIPKTIMTKLLIKSAQVVNEGIIRTLDVLIDRERISKIDRSISTDKANVKVINAEGLFLLPGLIDDQVHFREPGFTQKGTIYSESKAAVAGGITSFMDMPNTSPNALDLKTLEEKYELAKRNSLANYSFFMGINKNNLDQALKIDNSMICGLSDDGLYFDNEEGILANYPDFLEKLFSRTDSLVALHCEDDTIINTNLKIYKEKHGDDIPMSCHPIIRNENACYEATKRVIQLAEKHNTRFHALHISTALETTLFRKVKSIREKRITGEACVHHLWFSDKDYETLGSKIKWNPAIKSENDRNGLMNALLEDRLDIIATDHAPHLLSEKEGNYTESKSGAPLVQHALPVLLELHHQNKISLEKIVEKTSHHVAEIYRIHNRGYIREGYYADLVLVDLNNSWKSTHENTLYRCGWSSFENKTFKSKVLKTFINGNLAYDNFKFNEHTKGQRLKFEKIR